MMMGLGFSRAREREFESNLQACEVSMCARAARWRRWFGCRSIDRGEQEREKGPTSMRARSSASRAPAKSRRRDHGRSVKAAAAQPPTTAY